MIPSLPADKANHHMYGTWAAIAGGAVSRFFGAPGYAGAAALTVAVAGLKEAYDSFTGKGVFDPWDVVATCFGGVPVIIAFAAAEV